MDKLKVRHTIDVKAINKSREELLNNPEVLEIIKKEKLDPKKIIHLSRIRKYLCEKENCDKCLGKLECKNSTSDYYSTLKVENDDFILGLEKCKYHRKTDENSYSPYFFINHMPLANYSLSFKKYINNLDNSSNTPAYNLALVKIMEWVNGESQSLLLNGDSTTGKTYLLSSIANDFASEGKSICYIDCKQLVTELKPGYLLIDEYRNLISSLQACDVLILDSLGNEAFTVNYRDEVLFPIVEYRQNQNKKTIYSTNLTEKELISHYSYAGNVSKQAELLINRIIINCVKITLPKRD